MPLTKVPSNLTSISVTSVQTTTYPILTTDDIVLVSGASGSFSTTLPTAVGISGRIYQIKRTDQTFANIVTLATTSSQTIDGVTTKTLSTQNEEWTVISDGANWQVLTHTYPSALVAYTPTMVGFGTTTNQAFFWKREGDSIYVIGSFTAGTTTATEARCPFPTGLTSAGSTKLPSTTLAIVGRNNGNVTGATFFSGGTVLAEQSVTYATFGAETSTLNGITKINASQWVSTSQPLSLWFKIPIANWEG